MTRRWSSAQLGELLKSKKDANPDFKMAMKADTKMTRSARS